MVTLRVFDALIANTDRNKGNLLIDKDWKAVVHRPHARLPPLDRDPRSSARWCAATGGCSRRCKGLDEAALQAVPGAGWSAKRSRAILARRDAIVKKFEAAPSSIYTYAVAPSKRSVASAGSPPARPAAAHSTVRRRPSAKGTIGS